jgi:excinuclease ABC subunit C
LDTVPGVGPKSRQKLLAAFGSVAKIKKATEEELSYVQGINRKTAKSVYEFFHPV